MVYEIIGSKIDKHLWTPADFNVPRARLADLAGGDREQNCAMARSVLNGDSGPPRDIVLVNAAVGLLAAGKTKDLQQGVAMAAAAIDSGAARVKVEELALFSMA